MAERSPTTIYRREGYHKLLGTSGSCSLAHPKIILMKQKWMVRDEVNFNWYDVASHAGVLALGRNVAVSHEFVCVLEIG